MIALRLLYLANILVAGWISSTSLTSPETAARTVFQNAYPSTEVIRLVGCLWMAITVLSICGLWKPVAFSPVLLVQFIYKGLWLVVVAFPAFRANVAFPEGMARFFIVWVILIPFVVPWKALLK